MRRLDAHILFVLLIVLLALNVLVLDIVVFSQKEKNQSQAPLNSAPVEGRDQRELCGQTCEEIIQKKIENLSIVTSPTRVPTPSSNFIVPPLVKEFYIPLGSGSTRNSEWADLSGVETYIDTALYPNIQKIFFETHLSITTGQGKMYAKLYNVTDKHDVWFSEVSVEGGSTVRREAEIVLEPTNKLYRVMAKSTLSAEANVLNARIRILLK